MIKLTQIQVLQALAKALAKPCMYVSFSGDIDDSVYYSEMVKAMPYLKFPEDIQILSEGCAWLVFEDEASMYVAFQQTEFNQEVDPIQLISLALVAEDGREFYAISSEFDESKLDDWLKANVMPILMGHVTQPASSPGETTRWIIHGREDTPPAPTMTLMEIRAGVEEFIGTKDGNPEFWAYYGDYDWYLFTRLWGFRHMPKNFPFLCMDVKQYQKHLGSPKLPAAWKPEHNAIHALDERE